MAWEHESLWPVVAPRHAWLGTKIYRRTCRPCTRTTTLLAVPQFRTCQLLVRPLMLVPDQYCPIHRCIFSSERPSGLQHADNEFAMTTTYVFRWLDWSIWSAVCYKLGNSALFAGVNHSRLIIHVISHRKTGRTNAGQPQLVHCFPVQRIPFDVGLITPSEG